MKKYIYQIILLLIIVSFTTCKESFLEVENKNALTVENWYKTAEDYQMAINSCYGAIMDGGMFGQGWQLMFGSFSDEILFETLPQDRISINSSTGSVRQTWNAMYFGIYRTNKLLEQLSKNSSETIDGMEEAEYKHVMAQAKALRATYYFFATIVFNRPVFYTEETVPEDYLQNYGNGDPKEIWEQIEQDFEAAIPDLKRKSEQVSSDLGRVTKGGAQAMLAKALLYKHYYFYAKNDMLGSADDLADLEKAKQNFKAVMDSKEYNLIQPQEPKTRDDYIYAYLSNFSHVDLPTADNKYKAENNMESVWEVQYGDGPMSSNNWWLPGWLCPGELNTKYFGANGTGYRNHEANPALYFEFETEGVPDDFERDPRCYGTFYFDGDILEFREDKKLFGSKYLSFVNNKGVAKGRNLTLSGKSVGLGLKKYYFPVWNDGSPDAAGNSPTNRRIIRYADVLLMYAEVMHLLGDDGTGLAALNEVRARVDMPSVGALTKDAIKHERTVELAFEGHRWFDLIRWSFDPAWNIDFSAIDWGINSDNSEIPFIKGKHEFLPIPLREIDLNGGELEQNPGW